MSTNALADTLGEHPRMIGALFTIMLLLSQAGSVAANNACSIAGP